jgi:hypothetical protein
MKRFFAAILFVTAAHAFGGDFVVLSYLPSFYGKTVGTNVVWNGFKGREDEETLSMPIIEIKFAVASIGGVALNASVGYALYLEKDSNTGEWANSINVSLGMGVSAASESRTMTGFFMNAYPFYEFPVFTEGEPIARWKIALNVGYALDLGEIRKISSLSLHVVFYSRTSGAFADTGGGTKFYFNWPDFGIAVGTHIFWEKKNGE